MELLTRKEALATGAKHYFTGKPCKRGHYSLRQVNTHRCLECHRLTEAKRFQENRNWILLKQRAQRAVARQDPAWKKRKYANDKKSDLRFKQKHGVGRGAIRRRKSPAAKMAHAHRVRIRQVLRLEAQLSASDFLLGCSYEQLVQHLEAQFTDGMTWDNYGQWHVDHIRPCVSFDLEDPEQQRQCFNYTNLQPLWAEDNIRKAGTWEPDAA